MKTKAELMKLEGHWQKAFRAKCNADNVFRECNDKIIQLEVNTKQAELKRLEYLE